MVPKNVGTKSSMFAGVGHMVFRRRVQKMKANPALVSDFRPFSWNTNKGPLFRMMTRAPGSSEIPNRFVTHVFRAENPTVLWESLSADRSPAKRPERRRIKPTLFGTGTVDRVSP